MTTSVKSSDPQTSGARLEIERVRRDFPILHQTVNGRPLVYLDNAATGQKPQCVIDTIQRYYETDNANIHRGVHELSVRATDAYERARAKVQRFIGAGRSEEIVFVRSATEAVNLVAQTFGRQRIEAGHNEIVISEMEHHSNIVPWDLLCKQTGAKLLVAPINDQGELLLDDYKNLLSPRTAMVAIGHVSNALGTINPVRDIIEAAHQHDIPVLLDGAQAAPHLKIDVRELDCDFYAISSHKLFGPTGVGVLYGKYDFLNQMPPYQGGGEMIKSVHFDKITYNDVPFKFEAGTPNIAGAIGLGAAVDYVNDLGLDNIAAYEHELLGYATEALSSIPQLRLIGTAREKAAVLSFVFGDIHPHDMGTILNQEGIAVRTGHHCAQPVMDHFDIPATTRASLAFYNTKEEIDALVAGLHKVTEVFA
ncbi:MAG: cysteine desulfurase [Phycisphaerales bacterium]|nr:cysteine desulfurase [Phycisphaerales bacterium]